MRRSTKTRQSPPWPETVGFLLTLSFTGPIRPELSERCGMESKVIFLIVVLLVMASVRSAAQSSYKTITVKDGGTITGSEKWTGPVRRIPALLINKDPEICDRQAMKNRDLARVL